MGEEKKTIKLVTGKKEVMAFLQPVNPFLNPTDMHLNAYLSSPPATNTHTPQWSKANKSEDLYWLTKYINFAFLFVLILLLYSPTSPTASLLYPVRGEPQTAVWESGEATLKFLKQRLWQNQAISLPQTNGLK